MFDTDIALLFSSFDVLILLCCEIPIVAREFWLDAGTCLYICSPPCSPWLVRMSLFHCCGITAKAAQSTLKTFYNAALL